MNATQNLLLLMQQMNSSMTLPTLGAQQQSRPSTGASFEDMLKKAGESAAPKDKTKPAQSDKSAPEKTEVPEDGETCETAPVQSEEEKTAYQMIGAAVNPMAQLFPSDVQPVVEDLVTVDAQAITAVTSGPLEADAPGADTQPQTAEGSFVLPEETVETAEEIVAEAPRTAEETLEKPELELRETRTPVERRDDEDRSEEERVEGYDGESAEKPLFKDAEAAPVKVGERYELDTSAEDMDSQLTGAIRQAVAAGADTVQIHLAPENLGQLTIEMSRDVSGALQIVLHTTTSKAGALLTQHLDSLHAALQNMGHESVHVEVQRNQESAQEHTMHQQADPDGHGQNQHHQQQRRQQPANPEDFLQQLRLGLFSLEDVI